MVIVKTTMPSGEEEEEVPDADRKFHVFLKRRVSLLAMLKGD